MEQTLLMYQSKIFLRSVYQYEKNERATSLLRR